jgi:hypothetical protein
MDVAGFLDALCWGNSLATADPTVRAARTSLTHSDRLATVVSNWLDPPRTSQGGSKAGGARSTLLPLVVRTVKEIISKEMDAVVEELKEESADVTEQTVLGTVIDEVQGRIQSIAPTFYDIVRTAAWSEKQEERNSHRDPTKASRHHDLCCHAVQTSLCIARLVYHLSGRFFAESTCQQGPPTYLTLPKGLWHCGEGL